MNAISIRYLAVLVALPLLVVTTCGRPSPGPVPGPPPSWSAPAPAPAGPGQPSPSALQVCSADDGQKDIAGALGVTPTRVEQPTWRDHLYSCRYDYPDTSFVLSVKELADNAQTVAYIDQLAATLGELAPLDGIGEGAFYTRNRSIVARKDNKVLLVDVSALPPNFGRPPAPPAATSRIIATVIMGCWSGD
ncbi:MAG: hypothetical protein QOD82_1134 [Pseudonocardiales bacterium]|nr:hypothetical protein [Pseudonocardiales bacterium]